jgi:hypothetical protein
MYRGMQASIASIKQPPMEAPIPMPTFTPMLRPDADRVNVGADVSEAETDVGADVEAAKDIELEVRLLEVDGRLAEEDKTTDVDNTDDAVVAEFGQTGKLGSHML